MSVEVKVSLFIGSEIDQKIGEWLHENVFRDNASSVWEWSVKCEYLIFKYEEDAVAFKLKFGL
jgi:hypothetical protein